MLGQRRRRWANVKAALGGCVFRDTASTGLILHPSKHLAQNTQYGQLVLFYSWASVAERVSTLHQHGMNLSCLEGVVRMK